MKAVAADGHMISVEDAQTGRFYHFMAGGTQGFRYLGVQTDPPQSTPPSVSQTEIQAATAAARSFAQSNGWA